MGQEVEIVLTALSAVSIIVWGLLFVFLLILGSRLKKLSEEVKRIEKRS